MSARSGERSKKYRGVAHDELIERRTRRHEHRRRSAGAASGATGALPGGRDRSRIAGHHRHVQCADVDAELQGVGRDDGPHLTIAQPFLNLAAAIRQVATPVSANALGRAGHILEVVFEVGRQDLGGETTLGEDDELQVALQEFGSDPPGLAQVRATDAQLMIDDRRIDEHEEFLAARCAALVHELAGTLNQALGQLARVGNGRR